MAKKIAQKIRGGGEAVFNKDFAKVGNCNKL